MKGVIILYFLLNWISAPFAWGQKRRCFDISNMIFNNSQLEFKRHQEKSRYGSYLAMNISYGPVKDLYQIVEKNIGKKLKNRGEAHITVITPPEFENQLFPTLNIQEIHKIAEKNNIQNSQFQNVCIGRGEKVINTKLEQTYYIVVESEDLLKIRRAIYNEFVKKGGDPNLFEPEEFSPHITLGFTLRDLHESDGVIKNRSSCKFSVSKKDESCF